MKLSNLLLLTIMLIMPACAPAAEGMTAPTVEPTVPSSKATTSPEALTGLPPQAMLDAKKWLTDQLGAPIEKVKIIDIEQERWPDACLGLSQPGEICAAIVTPGWRVVLAVDGQKYEVRTDETGSIIRLAEGQTVFDLWEALRVMGVSVEAGGEIPQQPESLFSVQGQRYRIEGNEFQVYEYADKAAAMADARRISPDGFSIGTAMVDWVDTPHFFQRGRYLVLYLGNDAAILNLLEGVLGPQIAGEPVASTAADQP